MSNNRSIMRIICLLLSLAFFLPSIAEGEPDQIEPGKSYVVSADSFGMHIFYLGIETNWPSVPFGSLRLWDSKGTRWDQIEPKRGEWDFSRLDYLVAEAEKKSVELILTLGQSPEWASARPYEPSVYGLGRSAEPANESYWVDYVSKVAGRYKGRIKYYEIWNEPRFPELQKWINGGFFSGSVKSMVSLTKSASIAIKKADPSAKILSPAFDGGAVGIKKLDLFLSEGGGNYIDVVSFHFYRVDGVEPEGTVELIREAKNTMRKHGFSSMPLWNTETGVKIRESGENVVPRGAGVLSVVLPEEKAGAYLARTYILDLAAGIDRVYWFAWDSYSMGLLGKGFPRKPNLTAAAYQNVQGWLLGTKVERCNKDSEDIWICTLNKDNGRSYIAWSTGTGKRLNINRVPGVTRYEGLYGENGSIDRLGSSASLTGVPVRFY